MPEDEKGSLGLRLLDRLYPQHVGADRIWDYVEQLWTAPPPTVESLDGDKTRLGRVALWTSRLRGMCGFFLRHWFADAERLNKVLAQNNAAYILRNFC